MPSNANRYLIKEAPSNILAILKQVQYDTPGGRSTIPTKSEWFRKASEAIGTYLRVLSQSSRLLGIKLDEYERFPTEELQELRTTLHEMVANPYGSHLEIPVLEQLSKENCEKYLYDIQRIGKLHVEPCAKVLVNIKLDELGDMLYELALNRQVRSVERYIEFSQKSGWTLLRKYLLHAITFNWTKKPSDTQYEVLIDLIEAREAVQKDRLTVSQFWLALAGQTLDLTILETAFSDYLEASGNAFPKIQHIYSAPVYSWHSGSAQPRQLSLRKQAIYRNRFCNSCPQFSVSYLL